MDRSTFEELLDQSLLTFRQQLLESFTEVTPEPPEPPEPLERLEGPSPIQPVSHAPSEKPAPVPKNAATVSGELDIPDLGPPSESMSFELNMENNVTGSNSVASMWPLGGDLHAFTPISSL